MPCLLSIALLSTSVAKLGTFPHHQYVGIDKPEFACNLSPAMALGHFLHIHWQFSAVFGVENLWFLQTANHKLSQSQSSYCAKFSILHGHDRLKINHNHN